VSVQPPRLAVGRDHSERKEAPTEAEPVEEEMEREADLLPVLAVVGGSLAGASAAWSVHSRRRERRELLRELEEIRREARELLERLNE